MVRVLEKYGLAFEFIKELVSTNESMFRILSPIVWVLFFSSLQAFAGARPRVQANLRECSEKEKNEVLLPAREGDADVHLTCSLTLYPGEVVTRRVIIEGEGNSGLMLNCEGGELDPLIKDTGEAITIRSRLIAGEWSRPRQITVQGCHIRGSVRIYGMGRNAQARPYVWASSHELGHTERAQAAAPSDVLLKQVVLEPTRRIPLYLSPGVTGVTLEDSDIVGTSPSVAIYLDAESAQNRILNNIIHTETTRELIAVDGSAENVIMGNRFSSLNHGGIYLYRNCGEAGAVRHKVSSHNHIINNVFYYRNYSGDQPAVFVASRNGNRNYCGADKAYPFGSGLSDLDLARYNVIAENQIYKRDISEMIRVRVEPNYFYYNETVAQSYEHPSGCFWDWGPHTVYVRSGDFTSHRNSETRGVRLYCKNAEWVRSETRLAVSVQSTCSRSRSNSGCSQVLVCPTGRKVVGIKAACDLENATAPDLDAQPWETLRVTRASDDSREGLCSVDDVSIRTGETVLNELLGDQTSVRLLCRERDKNGGDCAIQAQMLCL